MASGAWINCEALLGRASPQLQTLLMVGKLRVYIQKLCVLALTCKLSEPLSKSVHYAFSLPNYLLEEHEGTNKQAK